MIMDPWFEMNVVSMSVLESAHSKMAHGWRIFTLCHSSLMSCATARHWYALYSTTVLSGRNDWGSEIYRRLFYCKNGGFFIACMSHGASLMNPHVLSCLTIFAYKSRAIFYWTSRTWSGLQEFKSLSPLVKHAPIGSGHLPHGLLSPLAVPDERWDVVTMDFIIDLPKSPQGNDAAFPRGNNGRWCILMF
jgi:hypothetical protein